MTDPSLKTGSVKMIPVMIHFELHLLIPQTEKAICPTEDFWKGNLQSQ